MRPGSHPNLLWRYNSSDLLAAEVVAVEVDEGMGEECIHLTLMDTGGSQTCETAAWSSGVIKGAVTGYFVLTSLHRQDG